MKILAIHNFHRQGSVSGDDQVFQNEISLLEKYGNEVVKYTISNDEFDNENLVGKIRATFGMLWSFKHYRAVQEIARREKPDIVHIHTFFPLLSPSVLYALKRMGIPIVATLHDTRFICPCATSLRGTVLCNECGDGHYFRMCRYNCFKGSKLQSFFVAGIFKFHRVRQSFFSQIDRYICLNETQILLLEKNGFDKKKIVKKYNFIPDMGHEINTCKIKGLPNRYVVFYGRIGEEKGVRYLMRMWDQICDIPLVVMGSGPIEQEFKEWADKKDNVYFYGYTQRNRCLSIVKGSEFVVFPSIWYEGCSMVEIEAESLGRALLVTDLGFSAEAIENGVNGYKVPLGNTNDFVKRIKELWDNPEDCRRLGINARKDYELKYMPDNNYQRLIAIYQEMM